ncbi:MAG: hypothetical protein JKX72_10630 [Robiginitomaculum sp.]|nr:hypothetical protein [Robiginitomaculum sp.]
MERVAEQAFIYFHEHDFNPEHQAQTLNQLFTPNRFRLIKEFTEPDRYEGEHRDGVLYFVLFNDSSDLIAATTLVALSDEYVQSQLSKA